MIVTRLADLGVPYVSHAAARAYARATGLGTEPARRALTELLIDAKQSEADPSRFRFRRRLDGVDVSVIATPHNRLMVVTSVIVHGAQHAA